MRVAVVTRNGGPEVLEVQERPSPEPGQGEVRVDVAAAGVNYMDVYALAGTRPYARDLPFVPGGEGAGTVSAVGPGVTGVAVGDRVAWAGPGGGYAEQVVLPADRAVPVPDGVDLPTAAAVLLQGLTAHYLTRTTHPVAPGDVCVVHAAAGGVGLLLVQLVRAAGGVVVATAGSADKQALAREAGADLVAGYDGLADAVAQAGDGRGAHVVYDGVGAATLDASLAALRRRGLLALYGAASGPVDALDTARLAAGGSLFVTRPTLGDHVVTREELLGRAGDVLGLVAEGRLHVRVGATYPLDRAADALRDLTGRRSVGKLLLLPE